VRDPGFRDGGLGRGDPLDRCVDRTLREQARRKPAPVEIGREAAAASGGLLAHHLGEGGDRLGAPGVSAECEPVEQEQPVGDEDAA
jgi:hypothetical protein